MNYRDRCFTHQFINFLFSNCNLIIQLCNSKRKHYSYERRVLMSLNKISKPSLFVSVAPVIKVSSYISYVCVTFRNKNSFSFYKKKNKKNGLEGSLQLSVKKNICYIFFLVSIGYDMCHLNFFQRAFRIASWLNLILAFRYSQSRKDYMGSNRRYLISSSLLTRCKR